jgi:hypothetical protein
MRNLEQRSFAVPLGLVRDMRIRYKKDIPLVRLELRVFNLVVWLPPVFDLGGAFLFRPVTTVLYSSSLSDSPMQAVVRSRYWTK